MPASVTPLPPEMLRRVCDPATLQFHTTAEIEPSTELIGQPRAARALEFGMGLKHKGYNIFVTGQPDAVQATAIRDFLLARCNTSKVPDDWVYVHNFETPHRPRPIALPAGQGKPFQEAMKQLVDAIKLVLPQTLDGLDYRSTVRQLEEDADKGRLALLEPLECKATEQGFALEETSSGLAIVPVHDDEDEEDVAPPTPEEQRARREAHRVLQSELREMLRQVRRIERETVERRKEIDRETVDAAFSDDFETVRAPYAEHQPILDYLEAARKDLLDQVAGSVNSIDEDGLEEAIDLRRYEVNLFVDNSETVGAPVILQVNPTHENLFGRFEYESQPQGNVPTTAYPRMKPGGLHLASGGYLILEASDFDNHHDSWEALMQAMRSNEIGLRAPRSEGLMSGSSPWPEPLPLNLKIILLGSNYAHARLSYQEHDFSELFKVHADFNGTMTRDAEHEQALAAYIARLAREEALHAFDRGAVARVVEHGSRMADHQEKLSTYFSKIADVAREADYLADQSDLEIVTAACVETAIAGRIEREMRFLELEQEDILRGIIMISTEGFVVGQVNGLAVYVDDEFQFGIPLRFTARTYMGEDGVIDIERENDMSDPSHSKGVLTMSAYLGGTYARRQPLSLNASLTAEQQYYAGGDSASSTEIYALLSSLGNIPLNQSIAVTGSVNQHGEVQPIGGVNGKIEGFFDICKARGLSGKQGVMIPTTNVPNLMLRSDVVQAVADGLFQIWAVSTIDQGIELLTGVPAGEPDTEGNYPPGTVHHAVMKRLQEMALDLKNFGEDDDDSKEATA